MNRNQNLGFFKSTSQAAVMKEAEYPVTPTKPRGNQTRQNYVGEFSSNPQSCAGSTRSANHSSNGVEKHLQFNSVTSAMQNRDAGGTFWHNNLRRQNRKLFFSNKNLHEMNNRLKARVGRLTAECDDMKREKTRSDKEYKASIQKISSEAEASKYLRGQLENFGAQKEALREDLMASRLQCQSLEEQLYHREAKLQDSLQTLKLCRDEARGLRDQVQALQKEMLAQVPNNEVITDEVFSRDFHAIVSLVKSLSRSIQPPQNVDILDALEPGVLLRDVSKHHWDTRARKKAYVEAWIWSVLIDKVFRYAFGPCKDLVNLHIYWCFIFGDSWINRWPKPNPESETWRFTTVTKLVGDTGQETLIAGQDHGDRPGLNAYAHQLQQEMLERRGYVANIIKSHLTAVVPTSDLSHISEVVNKAFALALDMSMQRFRVQVTWPDIGEEFEASSMTPVPDRNGEEIRRGVVAFIVNPGLSRWGNARGQDFGVCHEIVPSLVQLEPVQTRREALHVLVPIKQGPEEVQ
ncbi:hypothetical protein yc1106_08680 [Curvularia clavata]|uniref:Uncharacterized protein n=1 Tax=Curvularia clavata TaxID=95742 RepID=A0A9Q8ZFZ8_CURCL|nr:hypothetical protein yc1106_08680 [Curvularia clavata]